MTFTQMTPMCGLLQNRTVDYSGLETGTLRFVDAVIHYIANQKEHHRKKTFQEEYRVFLKKYNVEYDERYVWD